MSDATPTARTGTRSAPIRVAVIVVVTSAVAGALWGVLAPTEHLMVVADNRGVLLTGESAHRFDALALFVCIGLMLGAVSGVGSWLVRSTRGPVMAAVVVATAFAGSVVAAAVGLGVGKLAHPHVSSPPVGDVISFAPGLSTPLAVLAQPLAAALALVILASLSRSDDLRAEPQDSVSSEDAEPQTRP